MHHIVTVTKQVGIDAATPDEAVKAVLNGAGDVLAVGYNANPRPTPAGTQPAGTQPPGK